LVGEGARDSREDRGKCRERGREKEREGEREREREKSSRYMLRKSGGAKPPFTSQAAGRQPLSRSTP